MSGYAAAPQLAEPQSDAADEPLGTPGALPRPGGRAAAARAAVLFVGAACAVAAGAGAARPTALRRGSAGVLDVMSKAGVQCHFYSHIQPAGGGFSVEDATRCAEDLREKMKQNATLQGLGGYDDTDHEITVSFNVKSTADIDCTDVELHHQAIRDASTVVLSAALPSAIPHENSRSCLYTLLEADELHVNCEFTVSSAEDSKALWDACMSASDPLGSVAGELGFLEGPTVADVKCKKNALAW